MIINLNEDWRITTDHLNFRLEKRERIERGDNAGQLKWKVCGYYSGLQTLLNSIPDHLALSPSVQTLEDLKASWERLSKDVVSRMRK